MVKRPSPSHTRTVPVDPKSWMNLSTNTGSSVQTLDSECYFLTGQSSGSSVERNTLLIVRLCFI